MGFVSASTGYPCCRVSYVHKEKEGEWSSEKEFWLLPFSFYENSEQTSLDSPLTDQASTAIGCLWFPSRGKVRAQTRT